MDRAGVLPVKSAALAERESRLGVSTPEVVQSGIAPVAKATERKFLRCIKKIFLVKAKHQPRI